MDDKCQGLENRILALEGKSNNTIKDSNGTLEDRVGYLEKECNDDSSGLHMLNFRVQQLESWKNLQMIEQKQKWTKKILYWLLTISE